MTPRGTGDGARCQNRMAPEASHPDSIRIPVVQEELRVGRRTVETGRGVRLHKTVTEEALRIDEALMRQELDIEHVPIDAWVDGALPERRQEGETLVIPVLEEVLVVQKRVRLKEEIRITARARQQPASEQVVLREEHVSVERFDEAAPDGSVQDSPPQ